MRLLLNTHTFLWFVSGSESLSAKARELIEDAGHQPFLSIASVWEMAIKVSLGKLSIAPPFEQFILQHLRLNGILLINIQLRHTAILTTLPFHHRDPFDRIVIAQAISSQMPIVGYDAAFDAYPIERLW